MKTCFLNQVACTWMILLYLDLLIVKSCFWWVMWPLGRLVHYYKDNNNLNECFFKFAVKPASISQIYAENISRTCLTVRWENSHPTKFQVYDIFSSDEWNFQNMSVSTCKLWLFEIFLAFFFYRKNYYDYYSFQSCYDTFIYITYIYNTSIFQAFTL